jgi:hypothetical protein
MAHRLKYVRQENKLQTKKTNKHEKVNFYSRQPDRNDLR